MATKFNIVWQTVVTDVSERTLTVAGRRSVDGKAELITESGGWYIQLGNTSWYAGESKPPFEKGDTVRITLERVHGNKET